MVLSKQQRHDIKMMYGGCCSYCGVKLTSRWHVDHVMPLHRIKRYVCDEYGTRVRDKNNKYVTETIITYPERDVIENMAPACIKCNNDKSSSTLEDWRRIIKQRIQTLNESPVYASYQKAKRFGLVKEIDIDVVFWFEKFNNVTSKNH